MNDKSGQLAIMYDILQLRFFVVYIAYIFTCFVIIMLYILTFSVYS